MADFKAAIANLLRKEGGYAPEDNGRGEVFFGITQATLGRSPKDLTQKDAEEFYKRRFWDAYLCGHIANQELAEMFFEAIVNMGPIRPTTYLQQVARGSGASLQADGRMGPKTIAAVNSITPEWLIEGLRSSLYAEYLRLRGANPEKYADDFAGWCGRIGVDEAGRKKGGKR